MVIVSLALAISWLGEPGRTPDVPRPHTSPNAPVTNFRITQAVGVKTDLHSKCESTLASLREGWFGVEPVPWRPPCELVIHSSRESYLEAVGGAGRSTLGSARVRFAQGRIIQRRIDLLDTTPEETFSSLRHELIHLLFAERFPNGAPPRWAEEGLALSADVAAKQNRHRRDLQYAVDNNQLIPLPSLLTAREYPRGWQRAVFYGQSLSLVEYLVERKSPRTFIRFLGRADKVGYDQALQELYGVADVAALRHAWRDRLEARLAATQ